MMSSICWLVKSITVGRSLQVSSLTDHEHEPFWRSSTAISGSLLTFDAAEESQLMFCDVDLWCISWQRTRTLSATNLTTMLILKSARFEFVLFSKRFCTRLCFVLSFVFRYGGTKDSSLRLPCEATLNFLGFASLY